MTGINLGTNPINRFETGYIAASNPNPANIVYIDDCTLCAEQMIPGLPAVTSAVAEIAPNDVPTGSTATPYTYDILPTIGGGDTGIDQVEITVPGTFGVPTVTGVRVGGTAQASAGSCPTVGAGEYCATVVGRCH
jgi:hypothetical protein